DADLVALTPARSRVPEVLGGYQKPESDYVRAVNPLRSDWEIMRPTLVPSLLKVVAENLKFTEQVPIFETARVYQPEGRNSLPDERRAVAIVMAGAREPFSLYRSSTDEYDFFDIKGVVELLLQRLGASDATFKRISHPSLHPGRAAAIEYRGEQIGMIGELHPKIAGNFEIESRVCVSEIDLRVFAETLNDPWSASSVSRFQPVRQDFAIVVDEGVAVADVEAALRSGAGPLASSVDLFDVYRGTGIDDEKKSLAFRVTLSAPDRQLAEYEVERIRNKIEQNVKKRVGGSIRS
ncbi:MAG TPA: phenylalanine--tRNA ligase subunit beta, partial [Thermomicrobiales bacterium]|nr:phenylalanine--tRNA ligase subunit beta [Thermomicrobiales bacterium]